MLVYRTIWPRALAPGYLQCGKLTRTIALYVIFLSSALRAGDLLHRLRPLLRKCITPTFQPSLKNVLAI